MKNLCENIGFNIENIQFVAYSGYTGHNLVDRYEDKLKINKMKWYKGKTLLESLDDLKVPKRYFDKPLKISIFNVDKLRGVGTVLGGKILSGKQKAKMNLII